MVVQFLVVLSVVFIFQIVCFAAEGGRRVGVGQTEEEGGGGGAGGGGGKTRGNPKDCQ